VVLFDWRLQLNLLRNTSNGICIWGKQNNWLKDGKGIKMFCEAFAERNAIGFVGKKWLTWNGHV